MKDPLALQEVVIINTCCHRARGMVLCIKTKILLECREIIVRFLRSELENETENYFPDYRINICVSISKLDKKQSKFKMIDTGYIVCVHAGNI